jgi:hypothetical protein
VLQGVSRGVYLKFVYGDYSTMWAKIYFLISKLLPTTYSFSLAAEATSQTTAELARAQQQHTEVSLTYPLHKSTILTCTMEIMNDIRQGGDRKCVEILEQQ